MSPPVNDNAFPEGWGDRPRHPRDEPASVEPQHCRPMRQAFREPVERTALHPALWWLSMAAGLVALSLGTAALIWGVSQILMVILP